MSSIREQVVVAVVAALNAGGPPCTFERSRTAAVGDAEMPSGVVYPVRDVPQQDFVSHAPVVRSRLSLLFELRALGTASVRPDQAVDPLYAWVVSKLATNTLGGLVFDGWEEAESVFQYGQGDKPICLLTLEMIATYQHLTANTEAVE